MLDDHKRAELCALIGAGIGLRNAARLVGCSRNTVRNEARRNRQFAHDLNRAKSQAQVHPLRTMQQAATTNWRAAAWWLERLAPESFAQPAAAVLGRREANKFVADLIEIIDRVVSHPLQREQLHELLSAAMPAAMSRAWNHRQSSRKLQQAIDFFDGRRSFAGRQLGPADNGPIDNAPTDSLLVPDPATEREVERMLASLDKQFAERDERDERDEPNYAPRDAAQPAEPRRPNPDPFLARARPRPQRGETHDAQKLRPPESFLPPPVKNSAPASPPAERKLRAGHDLRPEESEREP
jgi:hypothetical protein